MAESRPPLQSLSTQSIERERLMVPSHIDITLAAVLVLDADDRPFTSLGDADASKWATEILEHDTRRRAGVAADRERAVVFEAGVAFVEVAGVDEIDVRHLAVSLAGASIVVFGLEHERLD